MTDNEKLDVILEKLVSLDQKVDSVKTELKQEMSEVKQDVSELKQEMSEVKQDVSGLKQDVSELKQEMSEVKQDVTGLKLHIENVTDKNIQIIAEGHLDLNRNLHEALKEGHQEELLVIRVSMLDQSEGLLQKGEMILLQESFFGQKWYLPGWGGDWELQMGSVLFQMI